MNSILRNSFRAKAWTPYEATLPRLGCEDIGQAEPLVTNALRFCALCLVLLGAFTAVYTGLLVHQSFSPVIDWDQWEVVNQVMRSGGHLTASQLWAQQNEHRIPFGRVACFADLVLFGGRNISLLVENYSLQALATLLFCFALKRFGNLSQASFLTATGFAIFCFFSPAQIDNFIRGFQITFLLCLLAASSAFAMSVIHAQRVRAMKKERWLSGTLIATMLCALVSEFSLSSGLLVWPILILLGYGLRYPLRAQCAVAGVAVVAIVLYFVDFHLPHRPTSITYNLRYPGELLTYILTYFKSTWISMGLDLSWPTIWHVERPGSKWPSFADSCTITALIFGLFSAARFLVRRTSDRYLPAFLTANIIFTVGVSFLTGLGRLNSGLAQAASIRYQSVALIFWASLAALAISKADSLDRFPKLLELQLAMIFLIMASAGRFDVYARVALDRKVALARGYASLMSDTANVAGYRDLYPVPEMVPPWFRYLQSRQWGPRAADFREFSRDLWRTDPVKPYRVNGYHVVPGAGCVGFLDSATIPPGPSDEVVTAGWAWDSGRRGPLRRILIVLATGDVIGETHTGLPRPDVLHNTRDVTSIDTGWAIKVHVPEHASIQAFGVLDETKSVCPLANAYQRQ